MWTYIFLFNRILISRRIDFKYYCIIGIVEYLSIINDSKTNESIFINNTRVTICKNVLFVSTFIH